MEQGGAIASLRGAAASLSGRVVVHWRWGDYSHRLQGFVREKRIPRLDDIKEILPHTVI